ncbi:MAG: carboxypeptidase regulatory-like domain-containing protein, partial [bacterium]
MRRVSTVRVLVALVATLVLLSASVVAQQVTGGVAGGVRDAQGGVLPGVTVVLAGEALIGGAQTTTTSDAGTYQITGLPPGMYVLTYELSGFTTLKRDGIRIQVAQNTRVDVEMSVGTVEETITVSGEAPPVDVTSTTTQTNIDKDFFDAVPTARNPWVMAALVPGVIAATLDVGGMSGMQQYSLSAYGSSSSQRSLSVDGVRMNWSGGDGGSANQYYGNEMFEQYNLQTASGTAESDVSGVFTNQVTRSGGNRVSGEYTSVFLNSKLQADNVNDRILRLLGAAPGTQVDAAGNPVDIMYDFSGTLGGPIKRDKVWFYSSFRWFRLDQFQIGAINPDGSLAVDDNLLRVGMGKVTYQATPRTRLSLLYMPHVRERFHRRNAPFLAVPDKAAIYNILPTESSVGSWNQTLGSTAVLNVSFGRVWGDFANRYQKDVRPEDIVLSDTVRNQRFNAHTLDEVNPNNRYQMTSTLSYFRQNLWGGSHEAKLGFQRSKDVMNWERKRNFDMQLVLRDGVASHALLSNTPVSAEHQWNTWALFLQDNVRLRRTTLNLGVRVDGAKAWLPAQSSPAGLWVGERSFPKTGVYDFSLNVGPRLGVVYDLFGNG